MKAGLEDAVRPGDERTEKKDLPGDGDTREPEFSPNAVHLVRTAQINTLTLSQMADQKANIMIGATFVVFSLSVTRLIGSEITLALLCLAATAFVSSLCAVIAVLPSTGARSRGNSEQNVLFFGHFAEMEEEAWRSDLMQRFRSDRDIYRTMLRDIYQNGRVLHRRKYRFLAYGYRTFLFGLMITMIVFAAEYVHELQAGG